MSRRRSRRASRWARADRGHGTDGHGHSRPRCGLPPRPGRLRRPPPRTAATAGVPTSVGRPGRIDAADQRPRPQRHRSRSPCTRFTLGRWPPGSARTRTSAMSASSPRWADRTATAGSPGDGRPGGRPDLARASRGGQRGRIGQAGSGGPPSRASATGVRPALSAASVTEIPPGPGSRRSSPAAGSRSGRPGHHASARAATAARWLMHCSSEGSASSRGAGSTRPGRS